MPTYSFTLKVTDADGRIATLDDTIEVLDAPVGEVALTARTITTRGTTPVGISTTISGSLTLSPSLALTTSDGQAGVWGAGVTAADYEVRFTPLAGAAFDGAATGTWLSLGTERTWSESLTANCADGTADAQITAGTLEIRDVATSTVQATATITFDQEVAPAAATVRLTDGTYAATALSLSDAEASAVATLAFFNSGALVIYADDTTTPPSEWGPSLVASGYEIRFTLLDFTGSVAFTASPAIGAWGNLGITRSIEARLTNTSTGVQSGTAEIRAEIRPVGGAVIATATYNISLEATRYPSGIIP